MRIYKDISLDEFEAWSGAVDTMGTLRQLDRIVDDLDVFGCLEDCIVDWNDEGMDETTVNDILWFETDIIAEWLGYEDWEALERAANGETEEEGEGIGLIYSVGDVVNYNGEKGIITEVDESDKDFPYCVKTDSMKAPVYYNGEWCADDELEAWEDEEE